MRNIELKEHQSHAIEALKRIKKCFEDNRIEYFLLAGTCLGSVREKGMIPWDDDIDIGIFVRDKEAVAELLTTHLSLPYRWVDWNVNSSYSRPHGKVLYNDIECVDIFTLIKTSDNAFLREVQWIKRLFLFKLYRAKVNYISRHEIKDLKGKIKLKIARIMAVLFSKEWIKSQIIKNEHKYEQLEDNKYYVNFYSVYGLKKEMIKAEWLYPKTYVEFEGDSYPTVGKTHEYLSHLYGDYMTPKNNNVDHKERF